MKTAVPCYCHLDVEVSPEQVGQVRRILAAHLRYWDLDALAEPVCQSAELLLRAIDEHATDKSTSIEMWWTRQHLITAFGQNDRYLRPDQDLRSCLVSIAALSDGWGWCATATGSKVIWFSQRARAGERAPLVPTAPGPMEREALQVPRETPVPLLLNGYWEPMTFCLPDVAYGERWTTRGDTADPRAMPDEVEHKAGTEILVEARSLVLLSRPSRTARGR